MPKEVIRGEKPYDGRWQKDESKPPVDVEVPIVSVVEVRWDRDTGYFQIATRTIDSVTGGDVLEYPNILREMYGERIDGSSSPEQEWLVAQHGFYVTLDRRGINDLVRVLRRARDQAFGKDE